MHQVQSLAISTQRATFLTWRKDSGEPIHNFITWKDLRASEITQLINRSWKMRVNSVLDNKTTFLISGFVLPAIAQSLLLCSFGNQSSKIWYCEQYEIYK